MRRLLIAPTRPRGDGRASRTPGRPIGGRWLTWLIVIAGLAAPSGLRAQTAGASGPTPLSRYIPKEHLNAYVEFAGLDAHAATWNKTAAYRLLTDTPLGPMLEVVAGQVLDKVLGYSANHKVTGPDCLTLAKHVARYGCVFGSHDLVKSGDAASESQVGVTVVLRGASSKEMRPISGRTLGWLMNGVKPRIERKENRTMVVVPYKVPEGAPAGQPARSWVWWAEKETDLVISTNYPAGSDAVIAALDGKIPGAGDHPIVQELSKPEADFDAVCIAFLDVAGLPKSANKVAERIGEAGIQRIDHRWGFDDDALKTITRIIAPKPRKPILALFDQPGFARTALLPMPEGVESFVELSISPAQLLDTVGEFGAEIKDKIGEFAETVEKTGRIDLKKDLLSHIGPRMVLYVAPGRSAAAGNESFETSWLQGFNPAKVLESIPNLPKFTLVAEVTDPVKFGKALDGAIIAMNNELKAQALEKAAEAPEEDANQGGGRGGNAGRGGRAGGAQGKGGSRRRNSETPAPKFEAMAINLRAQAASSDVKAFLLRTPSDSPIRLGPPNFRPVIQLDGKFLAISISADGAEAAIKAVKQKGWKPSDDILRACERLPAKIVMLGLFDPREVLSTFMASLPSQLQMMINVSVIARNQLKAGGNNPGGNQPNGPGSMSMGPGGPGGPGGPAGPGGRGGRMRPGRGGPMNPGSAGGPGGGAPSPGPGTGPGQGGNNPPNSSNRMIELKVDADKLPQAESLRSRLFPTSVSVDVSDQDVRLITRQAFPNLIFWSIAVTAYLSNPDLAEPAAKPGEAAEAGNTPPQGPGRGMGGPGGPGGMPGGPGGRRGRGPGPGRGPG